MAVKKNNKNNNNKSVVKNVVKNAVKNTKNAVSKEEAKNDFNSLVLNMTKNVEFKNKKSQNSEGQIYKNNKNYQSSFSNILLFEKTHRNNKDNINVVIYHGSNNDGLLSAYIAWRYLTKGLNNRDIMYYGYKPGHSGGIDQIIERNIDKLRDKNILILDLSYNAPTIEFITKNSKSLLIIDDHKGSTQPANNIFVGDDKHAACAYTWKFFYPEEKVPRIVQYIDDSDRKLHLSFLPYSHLFASSFGIRYGHTILQGSINTMFEKIDKLFEVDNPNYLILIGKYYEQYKDSIKLQISVSAREIKFQGIEHCYILNFNAPSLNKPVARQIITNIKQKGLPISFVILWGYEYSLSPPGYSITLMEDHMNKTPKYNLPELAKKLGKIGGHPKGGSGSKFEGHFYWSKNILELFN
jgi:hypothetical protein